jgi:hypothetical protein
VASKEKKLITKETVFTNNGRKLYCIKSQEPNGRIRRPGEAVQRLIDELRLRIDVIIMVEAALKLEGEKTAEIAEGIGSAIDGIGVEKYQIEQVATRFNIQYSCLWNNNKTICTECHNNY